MYMYILDFYMYMYVRYSMAQFVYISVALCPLISCGGRAFSATAAVNEEKVCESKLTSGSACGVSQVDSLLLIVARKCFPQGSQFKLVLLYLLTYLGPT